MNYFPFHIGDYSAHTGHLEPLEDLAYRRLLDLYYLREAPLPLDVQTIAKRIRMRSMVDVVEAVLNEFFIATDEGWAHSRVEAELSKMREKQDASEERDEHEKTRMQKHRERRSAMFAQLAEVGVYPPFNTKTGELESLIAANCGAPVTALVTNRSPNGVTAPVTALVTDETGKTSPVTALATAIPTPTPTPTPTPISLIPLPPNGGCPIASDGDGPATQPATPVTGTGNAPVTAPATPPKTGYQVPDCPYQAIVDAYHDLLPNLNRVEVISDFRKGLMRQRWREVCTDQKFDLDAGISWFRDYFTLVRTSEFLTGKSRPRPGEKPFAADLEWLVRPQNFVKVIEGRYTREAA